MSINHKQYIFALEYIKDYNATQAYIRAGYNEDNARQAASLLLTKVDIQELITELEANRIKAIKEDGNKIKADISDIKAKCISAGDPANALRASELLGRGVLWDKGGAGVKSISSNPDGTMKINFGEDDDNKPTDK